MAGADSSHQNPEIHRGYRPQPGGNRAQREPRDSAAKSGAVGWHLPCRTSRWRSQSQIPSSARRVRPHSSVIPRGAPYVIRSGMQDHMKRQPWVKRLGRHLGGHLFLFEARRPAAYDSAAGLRLLLIFILLEGVIGPRLLLFSLFGLPLPPAWLRVLALLVLAIVLVRFFAGVRLAQIGLYPWRDWDVTEASYFIQVLVIANVIFGIL